MPPSVWTDSFGLPLVQDGTGFRDGEPVRAVIAEIALDARDPVAALLDHIDGVRDEETTARLIADVAGDPIVIDWLTGLTEAQLGPTIKRLSPEADPVATVGEDLRVATSPVRGETVGVLRGLLGCISDRRRSKTGTPSRSLAPPATPPQVFEQRVDAYRDTCGEATRRVRAFFDGWRAQQPRLGEDDGAWTSFLRALRNCIVLALRRGTPHFHEHSFVEDAARALRTLIEQGYNLWANVSRKLGLAARFSEANEKQHGRGCRLSAGSAFRMRRPPPGTIEHAVAPALKDATSELARMEAIVAECRDWLNRLGVHGSGRDLDDTWSPSDRDICDRVCRELLPPLGAVTTPLRAADLVSTLFVPVALRLYSQTVTR